MTDNKNIRILLERFFAGETSVAEERLIADFFRSESVPEDLEQYRQMFAWYDGLSERDKPVARRRRNLLRYVAVAAAVVLIATISIDAVIRLHHRNEMEDMYAGSFIVKNGEKITDIDVVLSEMKRAEAMAFEIEQRCYQERQQLMARAERIENQSFNIPDYE